MDDPGDEWGLLIAPNDTPDRPFGSPILQQISGKDKAARGIVLSPLSHSVLLLVGAKSRPRVPPPVRPQSRKGSMIDAKEFRARLSLDFTVPRLHDVISAISSYDFPSSSRRTNTSR